MDKNSSNGKCGSRAQNRKPHSRRYINRKSDIDKNNNKDEDDEKKIYKYEELYAITENDKNEEPDLITEKDTEKGQYNNKDRSDMDELFKKQDIVMRYPRELHSQTLAFEICKKEFLLNIENIFIFKRLNVLFSIPFYGKNKGTSNCIINFEGFLYIFSSFLNFYEERETAVIRLLRIMVQMEIDDQNNRSNKDVLASNEVDNKNRKADREEINNQVNLGKKIFVADRINHVKSLIDSLKKLYDTIYLTIPSVDEDSFYNINKDLIFLPSKVIDLNTSSILDNYFGMNCLNLKDIEAIDLSNDAIKCFEENSGLKSEAIEPMKLKTLQEFLGYIISNHAEVNKAFLITCENPTEISMFFDHLFSSNYISRLNPKELKDKIEKCETYNKYINIYEYLPYDKYMKVDHIKELIGLKRVENINTSKAYTYLPTVKFIFLGNERPSFKDIREEENFKFCTIHLDFTKGDSPSIKKLLEIISKAELTSGFLSWMILGLKNLIKNNYAFSYPTNVTEEYPSILADNNCLPESTSEAATKKEPKTTYEKKVEEEKQQLQAFISEYFEFDFSINEKGVPVYTLLATELFSRYESYCEENSLSKIATKNTFYKRMEVIINSVLEQLGQTDLLKKSIRYLEKGSKRTKPDKEYGFIKEKENKGQS